MEHHIGVCLPHSLFIGKMHTWIIYEELEYNQTLLWF